VLLPLFCLDGVWDTPSAALLMVQEVSQGWGLGRALVPICCRCRTVMSCADHLAGLQTLVLTELQAHLLVDMCALPWGHKAWGDWLCSRACASVFLCW
jgi:hypothetical protein